MPKRPGWLCGGRQLYPNTMYSLEATEYAQQHGKFMEFHKAAYKALWEDGQDLGDLAALGKVAESVGLDSADLLARLESGEYTLDGDGAVPRGPGLRHQGHSYVRDRKPDVFRGAGL